DYQYDINGNLTVDTNKNITNIIYNHLNLPETITFNFPNGLNNDGFITNGNITYVYDAVGSKLSKTVSSSGPTIRVAPTTTYYAGNYVYKEQLNGKELQFFNHAEGYAEPNNSGNFDYIYQYKDHLGNIRLNYKNIGTATAPVLEILEENNYYPFGLEHKGYNNVVNGTENNHFNFNGKELDESLRLNWLDFGARNYMPDIGRTPTLDPSAENYFSVSPYGFFANNPISFTDTTGADILFWRCNSDGDGGGEWEQVSYDQLDEISQKALADFAKADAGKSFLGLFANKGDKIGDVEFTENGKYSNHNWNFGEYSSYGSAEGTTQSPIPHVLEGPAQEGQKGPSYIDFYTNLNTFIENNTDINFAETTGHEVFLHLKQYLDAYIEAFENSGTKGAKAVMDKHNKGNYMGYRDHFSMANKTKASKEYYEFINQLKSVFNPREVQKHVDAERKKNLNAAKAQKRASGDN